MRQTYKILAHVIAGLVVVQAAVMVFAVAGLGLWIDDGNSVSVLPSVTQLPRPATAKTMTAAWTATRPAMVWARILYVWRMVECCRWPHLGRNHP